MPRALIGDPKILLFDKATSALDARSGRHVQDALDQAAVRGTSIFVAHRLGILSKTDMYMIAVLQMGKVVEFGTHDQLTQHHGEGGIYFRMVEN